jgi:hypothetical protein
MQPSPPPPTPGELARAKELAKNAIAFRPQLTTESDRGCALLASAYLDDLLAQLLVAHLVDSPTTSTRVVGQSGPLGAFSARIDMAFLLGLIGRGAHHDLHMIRKIRNLFAHRPFSLAFSSPPVADRCRELGHRILGNDRHPRDQFTEGVMGVMTALHTSLAKATHREVPFEVLLDESKQREMKDGVVRLVEHFAKALAEGRMTPAEVYETLGDVIDSISPPPTTPPETSPGSERSRTTGDPSPPSSPDPQTQT